MTPEPQQNDQICMTAIICIILIWHNKSCLPLDSMKSYYFYFVIRLKNNQQIYEVHFIESQQYLNYYAKNDLSTTYHTISIHVVDSIMQNISMIKTKQI